MENVFAVLIVVAVVVGAVMFFKSKKSDSQNSNPTGSGGREAGPNSPIITTREVDPNSEK